MNLKLAKAMRRELIPEPRKDSMKSSRGQIMRALTEHGLDMNYNVINRPETPRGVYRQVKKRWKRSR